MFNIFRCTYVVFTVLRDPLDPSGDADAPASKIRRTREEPQKTDRKRTEHKTTEQEEFKQTKDGQPSRLPRARVQLD